LKAERKSNSGEKLDIGNWRNFSQTAKNWWVLLDDLGTTLSEDSKKSIN
jgi:hypothetical protein